MAGDGENVGVFVDGPDVGDQGQGVDCPGVENALLIARKQMVDAVRGLGFLQDWIVAAHMDAGAEK